MNDSMAVMVDFVGIGLVQVHVFWGDQNLSATSFITDLCTMIHLKAEN